MPYTAKQRRYFHAAAARGEKGMKKLAEEADQYAASGKEKKPVTHKKTTLPAKVTQKQKPSKPAARGGMFGAKEAAVSRSDMRAGAAAAKKAATSKADMRGAVGAAKKAAVSKSEARGAVGAAKKAATSKGEARAAAKKATGKKTLPPWTEKAPAPMKRTMKRAATKKKGY